MPVEELQILGGARPGLAETVEAVEERSSTEPSRHGDGALAQALQLQLRIAHAIQPSSVARLRILRLPAHATADQMVRSE